MKIALAQMDIRWEDKDRNLSNALESIQKAAAFQCDAIVFPEMLTTGFSMNIHKIGEPLSGNSLKMFSKAAEDYGVNIIGGIAVLPDGLEKGHNSAFVLDRHGKLTGKYIKNHPFSYAGEDIFYDAGTDTVIFNLDGITASVFICYDLRFPELFRKVARQVNAIFVIANWPLSRKDHWEVLLKARAIENQCFIIGVNRVGTDGNGIEYDGGAVVYDPMGNIICKGENEERLIVCEIDTEEVKAVRSRYPFLEDMRELL